MTSTGTTELATHPLVRVLLQAIETQADDPPAEALRWLDEHPEDGPSLLLSLSGAATLRTKRALGGGELPSLATTLLGQLQQPSTVEPLLGIMSDVRHVMPDAMHREVVWEALESMGDSAIVPTLRYYRRQSESKARRDAVLLLTSINSGDARVLEVVRTELPNTPCTLAAHLGILGRESELPALYRAFDMQSAYSSGEYGPEFPGQALFDLYDAISECSGQLSREQRKKYERAYQLRYPGQAAPVLLPRKQRKYSIPKDQRVQIMAYDVMGFCQQALTIYGTVRKTCRMIGVSPAALWQCAFVQVNH